MHTHVSQTPRLKKRRAGLALLALCGLLGTACPRKTAGPVAAKDDLALSPKETDIVFMVNVTRLRKAPLWQKFLEFRDKDPATKKPYEDFVRRCQWDPQTQLDSLFVALPQNSGQTREFAVLGRGKFNEAQLVTCLKATARDNMNGAQVQERDYHGHKIYTVAENDGSFTVLGNQVAVLAGKTWIDRVVDQYDNRAQGAGAREHAELGSLMKRTRTGDALWAAGLVPPSVSERLRGNPQLGSAGTVKSVSGSVDAEKGLLLHLDLDLATEADAGVLAGRINDQLATAKKAPRVQMMGLTGYFDSIKVGAKKDTLSAMVELTPAQVDDLVGRLSGLLRGFSGDGF